MKTKSSLDGVIIKEGRRRGNTTRIVNNAIELLFEGYDVKIEDHRNDDLSNAALKHKIAKRLAREHKKVEVSVMVKKDGTYIEIINS